MIKEESMVRMLGQQNGLSDSSSEAARGHPYARIANPQSVACRRLDGGEVIPL